MEVSKHNLLSFARAIPHGYATTMFSDNLIVGMAMLILTLASPIVGMAGLLGMLTGLLSARLLGFDTWDSSSGISSFNSLLMGLTIGYYYPYPACLEQPIHFLMLVIIAAILVQMLYVGLNYLTQSWFRMPSMSLAFSITALFFWYYLVRSGLFVGTGFVKPLLLDIELPLSGYWRDFFVSMGSIMFVPQVWAGLLLTVVLFTISRIATLLALMGWTICYFLLQYSFLGTTYGMFFPGFNMILISLAIGSVFLIPGKSSYVLAALATVFGFLLSYALSGRFYFADYMPGRTTALPVPMFAFPVNLIVLGMVFALRLRLRQNSPIINDYGILHPEKALDTYLSRYNRFQSAGIPQIHMPVTGQWLVTQGHNGEHTHKREWAYAWDFEIEDASGKRYSDSASEIRDYYCYGKPVYAAAAGEVVKIVNSVADNPIGTMNTRDNWGNYITIHHGYGFYTLYAHLKSGSIKLAEGDKVKQGDKIGLVGNSGRSPIPHLHFQAQSGVDAGSRSLFCHIINYKIQVNDKESRFESSAVPKSGEVISPLVPEKELGTILQLGYGQEQSYQVESPAGETSETWKVEVDLLGMHTIVSDRGTRLDFSVYNGIFNSLSVQGKRDTALAAFAIGASRLPWVEHQSINFTDVPSLSVVLNPFGKNLMLFFIPFFKPLTVKSVSTLHERDKVLYLASKTAFSIMGMRISSHESLVKLSRAEGIVSIELTSNNKKTIRAKRVENPPEDLNEI